ncbi:MULTISPECIES: antibiotic biosynthesis monooxygenase [unclassified Janibacter]|uniref:antibiotic biosynthesis monooxygenase n=1 Tax=unclassified Janibacter TaxID=2649294 RepID=UPI003D03E600
MTAVTVAITRRVSPQDTMLMQAWVDAGTSMAERFPGFLGAGWVRPGPDSSDWHMLYRFDGPESLRTWETSTERRRWLASGSALVEDTRREHRTGIEGWFDEPRERTVDELTPPPPAPQRWKQAVVIWFAFFPTSLALAYLLAPITVGWPTPLRVLLSTVLATPWMTYILLPLVTRAAQPWLTGSRGR